jgi:hypothetical protein
MHKNKTININFNHQLNQAEKIEENKNHTKSKGKVEEYCAE